LAGLIAALLRKSRNEKAAPNWPSVEGSIVMVKVSRIPKTTRYLAILEYSYFLGEIRVGKFTRDFSKEDDADDFVRRMKDKRVQIRYKPSNPNESVLEQRVVDQQILPAAGLG
jgi:Protein of unknown function (DUF3592)